MSLNPGSLSHEHYYYKPNQGSIFAPTLVSKGESPAVQAHRILTRIGKNVKGGLPAMVANSAGRLALRLAGQVYPWTYKAGQEAIGKTLFKVWKSPYFLLKNANKKNPAASHIVTQLAMEGKYGQANEFLQKLGQNVVVSENPDRRDHWEYRLGRTVKKNIIVFDRSKIDAYAASGPERRIGTAAHGFVVASRMVRKRRSADVIGAGAANLNRLQPFKDKPAEIVKHKNGNAFSNGSEDNPIVTIENSFPGIKFNMPDQAVAYALDFEEESLRKQLLVIIRKEAKRLKGGS